MATAKVLTSVTNDKEFNKVLGIIKTSGDFLANQIHIAGLFALSQVNLHGRTSYAVNLLEAMGTKHDKKRVQQWLCFFGKLTISKKLMVFKKRKDISPENVEAWLFRANETPYWELNKQAELKVTFDYLSLVNSIIKMHDEKAVELREAGKDVTENNVGLLDGLKQLVQGYTPVVIVK